MAAACVIAPSSVVSDAEAGSVARVGMVVGAGLAVAAIRMAIESWVAGTVLPAELLDSDCVTGFGWFMGLGWLIHPHKSCSSHRSWQASWGRPGAAAWMGGKRRRLKKATKIKRETKRDWIRRAFMGR